ncbi:S-adenosylmethionine:tRNA ribosyltransferase-isomerase [Cohnella sp. CFH 77786]|uniref:S-adenosylmethionine:tRNA ribosyltransferase-isomerase n=1 Tax=Cohnella sp. CFH 77786 TaxID=2662265 RepID=UPI001C610DE6|nr:S-adenosylmethionine:tRNA ribosyltransferase-isomerase [Cohnella sp. CFH 77786]MBW5448855.1 S-adenosylmethionine:tRNA ribosyltransferase-isomerase [Cohnella sp. CFH 77786]
MSAKLAVFDLPSELNATMPPERRGVRRDHVNLMVLDRQTGATAHARFCELDRFLRAGDLIVLNASRTVPAVLRGRWRRSGADMADRLEIRLARRVDDRIWEALPVEADVRTGDTIEFAPGWEAGVIDTEPKPFVRILFTLHGSRLIDHIYAHGEPVRYEYITHPWELDDYQTVYASVPGSVEMPSAGRAFSWELIFKLQRQGVKIAYVQLHTGLSYLLDDSAHLDPSDNFERYEVPLETADAIRQTKASGGRVVAVGTTVVRALETAVDERGDSIARSGWTNLRIDRSVPLRVADGLITGFHEPEASHLDLLEAFIAPDLLYPAYEEAIRRGYLWHEFGDMNLIL